MLNVLRNTCGLLLAIICASSAYAQQPMFSIPPAKGQTTIPNTTPLLSDKDNSMRWQPMACATVHGEWNCAFVGPSLEVLYMCNVVRDGLNMRYPYVICVPRDKNDG